MPNIEGTANVNQMAKELETMLVALEGADGLEDPDPARVLEGQGSDRLGVWERGWEDAAGLAEDALECGDVVAGSLEAGCVVVGAEEFDGGGRGLCPDKLDGWADVSRMI